MTYKNTMCNIDRAGTTLNYDPLYLVSRRSLQEGKDQKILNDKT